MSHVATRWAWSTPARGVPQHVLLALAERANKETHSCFPSLEEIAEQTGLGVSTIRRALRALEDDRLIVTEVTNGGRRQRSTYYLPVAGNTSKPPRSGRVSGPDTQPERAGIRRDTQPERAGIRRETQSDQAGIRRETQSDQAGMRAETRPQRSENPPAAGAVVLRTKTGTREPGTTSAAFAALAAADLAVVGDTSADDSTGTEDRVSAQPIVGAWIDAFRATGNQPLPRQIKQAGNEIRQLLDAGNDPARVRALAEAAGSKCRATIVNELSAQATRNQQWRGGGATPSAADDRIVGWQSLKNSASRPTSQSPLPGEVYALPHVQNALPRGESAC